MAFLLRTLCAVIGAAFLFLVANLVVSGLPDRAAPAQLASSAIGALTDATPPLLDDASPQPVPSVPPAPSRLARDLEADWRAWMAANGLTEGSMVVLFPDGTQHRAGIDRDPSTSVPVASLSKAITGICMDIVLREQGLGWNTTLDDIAPQMSAVRVTPQPWNAQITLASLVTHTSGLAPDLTQGTMGNQLHGALGLHRRIASEALQQGNIQGTPGTFFYNNTNYAVLGLAIEALTGQSYAEACMDRVVTPAGITDATIQGRVGSRSSYGGWEFSAESYARLAHYWFTQGRGLVAAPSERPLHDNYALGYRIEGRGSDAEASHTGRFCGGSTEDLGSVFHARGDGVVFVANWSGACVSAGDTGLALTLRERM